eukprot:CAMPEP_0183579136 /NCGR_PEP_ID=MMETSP0371-20130417/143194_1 /TAXON_ID=268820 /ORGANISM="Peridinium aciculiferum, Strain PAER-2" /LENGTH=42 /DNA_ID= /DNA_START= /DNA_END= /DNA_ORIENTATION=
MTMPWPTAIRGAERIGSSTNPEATHDHKIIQESHGQLRKGGH